MGVIYHHKKLYGNNPVIQCVGGGGYAPVGTVIAFMGNTAPQDYLPCDGTVYFIADWPQLSGFFESEFGAANHFGGNGTTTFAVPDLRGEFLRGYGTNSHSGQGSGSGVGVHQDGTVMNSRVKNSRDLEVTLPDYSTAYSITVQSSQSTTESGFKFTSRPTNTSVMFCIKAIASGTSFGTTEHYVGQWIDNKPLYQITIIGTTINTMDGTILTGLTNIDYCELVDFQVSNGTYRRNLLDSVGIKEDGSQISMIADSGSTFKNKSFTATILFTKISD